MSPHQKFGLSIENWAADYIRGLGYAVHIPSNFFYTYDLIVEGILPVHVKGARVRPYKSGLGYWSNRYQFNFTSCLVRSAFVPSLVLAVVACRDGNIPFLIPSFAFAERAPFLNISSRPYNYSGWAAVYREDAAQVEYLLNESRRLTVQLPLFQYA